MHVVVCPVASLWKDVTRCLKDKDVQEATKYKLTLETRQRAEEKDRKEKKVKWQTKVCSSAASLGFTRQTAAL